MKYKIFNLLLIVIITIFISGCNNISSNEKKANDILNNNSKTTESNTKTDASSKILIVYFSKTGENYNVGNIDIGNTAMMVSYIKEYLNADSFEIIPIKAYPDNYKEATEVASKELKDNARPKIKNQVSNINEYDTIFIGYPIWWGDLPMIVYTFLESYDFNGKTIIPFNTHEGSGDSGTYTTIKDKLKESNVNTNGLALQGKVARESSGKEQTIKWLKELGY